jgi:hypothetical protein
MKAQKKTYAEKSKTPGKMTNKMCHLQWVDFPGWRRGCVQPTRTSSPHQIWCRKNILGCFDRTRWKKYVGECVCVHSLTAMSPAFTLVVDVLAAVVPVDVLWDTRFWVVLGPMVTPPSVGATEVAMAIFVNYSFAFPPIYTFLNTD